MPRLTEKTLQRIRGQIEGAAVRLLATKGYEATGMRDVAEAAGMSSAALYNHYASKEDLFGAVVGKYRGRVADDTSDNPLRDYARVCRFPDDLPELARALEAIVLRDRHYLVLWYIDLLSFSGRHFRNELAPNVLLSSGQVKARLDELRRTKALRVEPGIAFTMIYVHLFNFFLVEHIFGSGNAYGLAKDDAVRAICDAFLHGIVGDRRAARTPARRARKRR